MKAHLMYIDADFDLEAPQGPQEPDVIQDLGLDVLLDAMADGDDFLRRVATRGLLDSLTTPEQIAYRQHVLDDCLNNREFVIELYNLAISALKIQKGLFGGLIRNPSSILHHSLEALHEFVGSLHQLRDLASGIADRFHSEGFTTLFDMLQRELSDDYFAAVNGHLKRLQFNAGVFLSAGLGEGNKAADYTLRVRLIKPHPWWDLFPRDDGSSFTFRIPDRDEAGANAIGELKARGINVAANALAQSTDHILNFFQMLRTELGFYIGALNLHKKLDGTGEDLCVPVPVQADPPVLHAAGLYDTVLALTVRGGIVGNDLAADNKLLIMITGANQGGKSTLLRSIGQAQLMMQAGLMVCARSFSASVCPLLVTHYMREEDRTLTSGKLDEELARMSVLAGHLGRHDLVLFNESFASTNEREGSEIARHVIRALTDNGIRVIFVTHLYDLANSLYQRHSEKALFLRAQRGTGGNRTFRIVEGEPLRTSFGSDLYQRIFGSVREGDFTNADSPA